MADAVPDLNPLLPAGLTQPTMSSREIADLCEARHNDVVATIDRLFEAGVLRESRKTLRPFTPPSGGRPTEVYDLSKRDSLVVVSGYNDHVRARIIDRWIELEAELAQRATPVPGTIVSIAVRAHESASVFTSFFGVASLIGMDKPIAALSANRATQTMTGLDVLGAMGAVHLVSERQERVLTPTDLGVEMGGMSAIAVNRLLVEYGFQTETRDGKGKPVKEPTAIGEPFKVWVDTGKKHGDGSPVHQLKWSAGIVEALQAAIGKPQTAEAMS